MEESDVEKEISLRPLKEVDPKEITNVLGWEFNEGYLGVCRKDENYPVGGKREWRWDLKGEEKSGISIVSHPDDPRNPSVSLAVSPPKFNPSLTVVEKGRFENSVIRLIQVSGVKIDKEGKQVKFVGKDGRLSVKNDGSFLFEPTFIKVPEGK